VYSALLIVIERLSVMNKTAGHNKAAETWPISQALVSFDQLSGLRDFSEDMAPNTGKRGTQQKVA